MVKLFSVLVMVCAKTMNSFKLFIYPYFEFFSMIIIRFLRERSGLRDR